MIKRVLLHSIFVILLTAMQTTWLNNLPITPGLLLVFALFAALFEGAVVGGVYGLICGIVLDTFSGGPAFLNTLLLFYVCIAIGVVSNRVISRTQANGVLLITAFSAIYFLVYYFFSLLIWGNGYSLLNFLFTFFLYVLSCGISAVLLYLPVRWSFRSTQIL